MLDLEYTTELVMGIRYPRTWRLADLRGVLVDVLARNQVFTDTVFDPVDTTRLHLHHTSSRLRLVVDASDFVLVQPYLNYRTMPPGEDRDAGERASAPYADLQRSFMATFVPLSTAFVQHVRLSSVLRVGVVHTMAFPADVATAGFLPALQGAMHTEERVVEVRLVSRTAAREGELFQTLLTARLREGGEPLVDIQVDRQHHFTTGFLVGSKTKEIRRWREAAMRDAADATRSQESFRSISES